MTLNEDLAKSQGINTAAYELLLLLTLAAVIAMAIKLVGIVLVTAMLIIPAATGQNLARSIGSMFLISSLTSLIGVTGGMIGSALLDIPSGPAIVLSAALLCLISFFFSSHPTSQRGSALLSVSLIVFLISAAAAGFIWYQLHPTRLPGNQPGATAPTSPSSPPNFLNPTIDIDYQLQEQQDQLQSNLIDPVRQYYATQDTQLKRISVQAIEHESYATKVTLTIGSSGLGDEELSFLYNLTPWTPSQLENQPEETE